MTEWVEGLVAWMAALPPGWVYGVVLTVAYLENVLPPVPGDLLVVFGGYLVGIGHASFGVTAVLAVVGGALGFATMFGVGWRVGAAVTDPNRLRWIPKGAARAVEAWFRRWGIGVVLANRFLSGARSVIALMAGASRMRPVPVLVAATVSAAVWCVGLVWLGAALGERWRDVVAWLGIYGQWVTAATVLALAVFLGRRAWRRRRAVRARRGEEARAVQRRGGGAPGP